MRLLDGTHQRDLFDCGEESLTQYLRTIAGQDSKRHAAVAYILSPTDDPARVAGYYTLASTSVRLADFPAEIARKFPRYPLLPATLIGRLAVNQADRGKRLGERLLIDALSRSLTASSQVASLAVVVDALHEKAAEFYRRFGFIQFADTPLRLFYPMKDIDASFSA